jgi:hypothetical protein
MTWKPSRIVTLLTDFGQQDAYVGVMKGVLYSHAAELRAVVDLTHDIEPQDVHAAAFQLMHAWRWFPEGTVHVAVVDPGVGSERAVLMARDEGHVFLAPDNGLLGPVLSADAEVRALDVERFGLPERSRTFHGRDVFAPAAAAIAQGLDPSETGPPTELTARASLPAARRQDDGWAGEVVLVDRFGNLISNVPADAIAGDPASWTVRIRGRSLPVRSAYAEGGPGELLALADSFGRLEVAQRDGNAAAALVCGRGEPLTLGRTR